jgi:hypothetical protein
MVQTAEGKNNKRQEVFDVLIENSKVKTIFISPRPISLDE